jgi:hypothetical protein
MAHPMVTELATAYGISEEELFQQAFPTGDAHRLRLEIVDNTFSERV